MFLLCFWFCFLKIVSKKHNMPIVGLLGIGKVFQEEFSYSIKNYEGRGDGNLPLHYDLSLFSNPLSFGFVNIPNLFYWTPVLRTWTNSQTKWLYMGLLCKCLPWKLSISVHAYTRFYGKIQRGRSDGILEVFLPFHYHKTSLTYLNVLDFMKCFSVLRANEMFVPGRFERTSRCWLYVPSVATPLSCHQVECRVVGGRCETWESWLCGKQRAVSTMPWFPKNRMERIKKC